MEHPDERGNTCPSLMQECFDALQEKGGLPPTHSHQSHHHEQQHSNDSKKQLWRSRASSDNLLQRSSWTSSRRSTPVCSLGSQRNATAQHNTTSTAGKNNKEQRLAALRAASPIGVACLVKQFLRELPEPLLSKALSPLFVSAGRTEDEKERDANLRLLLKNLPPLNRRVLRALVAFLQLVVERSDKNRMTADNLGIVFAPTILYTDPTGADSTALADAGVANSVVSRLITNFNELLPDEQLPLTPQRTPQITPAGTPTTPTPHSAASSAAATPRTPLATPATGAAGERQRKKSRPSSSQLEQEDDDPDDDDDDDNDEEEEEEDEDEEEQSEQEDEQDEEEPTKEMLEALLTAMLKWEEAKEEIKRDLVAFDAAFAREHGGRVPTEKEKQPMKERYGQYRQVKEALEKIQGEYRAALARCVTLTEADVLPQPYNTQSAGELRKTLLALNAERRNQRFVLSRWSREFVARHGRQPKTMIDFAPVQEQFDAYTRLKCKIGLIGRYLNAHKDAQ